MKKLCWFYLSILIVALDQLSKYAAEASLVLYEPVPIIPMLNITLAYNQGAAFSFLSTAGGWQRIFFALLSFFASIFLGIWLYRTPWRHWRQSLSLSLILGGAVGNLIDRAYQGYVVDFIDVYYQNHHFATFNIADSAISVGAVLLMFDLLLQKDSSVVI
jgi:signal peptidase II